MLIIWHSLSLQLVKLLKVYCNSIRAKTTLFNYIFINKPVQPTITILITTSNNKYLLVWNSAEMITYDWVWLFHLGRNASSTRSNTFSYTKETLLNWPEVPKPILHLDLRIQLSFNQVLVRYYGVPLWVLFGELFKNI